MKKNIISLILLLFYYSFTYGQMPNECGTPDYSESIYPKSGGCLQQSSEVNDYFRRFEYQKDLYSVRNSMIIPIDIYIWQKDDGSDNYTDNSVNRAVFEQAMLYLSNNFYNSIDVASFQPFPIITNYSSSKIRFVLKNIYFEKKTLCWQKGLPLYIQQVNS